jgi:hypothetical protein
MILVVSRPHPRVPNLNGIAEIDDSNQIQKLPDVNGDNLSELYMKLTAMGVDPKTKHASFTMMYSFT